MRRHSSWTLDHNYRVEVRRKPGTTSTGALRNPAFATAVFVAVYTLVVYPAEHADAPAHSAGHGPVIRIEDVARFYKV